jgi:ParB-like chromosome segregation protein Spo0J
VRPRGRLDFLPVESLAFDPHIRPSIALVRSIRDLGCLMPILIEEGGRVIEGRRRLEAARQAGLSEIPAHIVPPVFDLDALSAHLNSERGQSPVEVYRAVVALKKRGMAAERIARLIGITTPTIRAYESLSSMDARLVAAFERGDIRFSVARMAARKSRQAQRGLVAILRRDGTITAKDCQAE